MDSLLYQHNEYNQALWHHSIVWHLFGDKETSKSRYTKMPCVFSILLKTREVPV